MKKSGSINNKLNRRILIYILLASVFLSACSVFAQMYADYKDNMAQLEQLLDNIEKSYLPPISTSLWDFNETLVLQQIQGIANLENISLITITTSFGKVYQAGDEKLKADKIVEYPITYGENNLGVLVISTNYQDIYKKLWQQTSFKLSAEIIKTLMFVFFTMCIVYWFITRHIYHISQYVQQDSGENKDAPLTLQSRSEKKDELDLLADKINIVYFEMKKNGQIRR